MASHEKVVSVLLDGLKLETASERLAFMATLVAGGRIVGVVR